MMEDFAADTARLAGLHNETLWISTSNFSRPVLVLLSLIVVGGQLTALFERGAWARSGRWCALWFLRLIGTAMTLALLWQPGLNTRAVRTAHSQIAVVVDDSASMALTDDQGTRWDAAMRWTQRQQPLWKHLSASHSLSWHGLVDDNKAHRPHADQIPRGDKTELLAAIDRAIHHAAQPVAAVLLLSDGADQGVTDESAQKRLQALKTPVTTVAVGAPATGGQIAIDQVTYDSFAFVKVALQIDVDLIITDLGRSQATIYIDEQGEHVAQAQVDLPESHHKPQHVFVNLTIRPQTVGDHRYEARVQMGQKMATSPRSHYPFVVRVLRDKVRVLHVAGQPSWDVRFLRQELKQAPGTDVVSFFILRTPDSDMSIDERELALIPFPVDRLFTSELKNFDVVILQDFDFRPYAMAHYLPNLRQAVQEGVGLAIVGGPQSFGQAGYHKTPLADLMPLVAQQAPLVTGTYRAKLTPLGLRHPLIRHLKQLDGGETGLPAVGALNATSPGFGSAQLLLEADADKSERVPLLAVGRYGKGQTLAIASDGLWHWRFSPDATAQSRHAYSQLWRNALRWLSGDPQDAHLHLATTQQIYDVSEEQKVVVTALNEDLTPAAAKRVALEIQDGHGRTMEHIDLNTDDLGQAAHTWAQRPMDSYLVVATMKQGDQIDRAEAAYAVNLVHRESREQQANPGWLVHLAKITGGMSIHADDHERVLSSVPIAPHVLQTVESQTITPRWDSGWVLGLWLAVWLLVWAFEELSARAIKQQMN